MKNLKYIIATITLLLVITGCNKDSISDIDEIQEPAKKVAIEILQEKERYQFAESIHIDDNAEFLKGEIIQNMPERLRVRKTVASSSGDTIKTADEVPVIHSETITKKIYEDGSSWYEAVNTSNGNDSPFTVLNFAQHAKEDDVGKIIIYDGIANTYNQKNELVGTEKVGDMNYTGMLDDMRVSMAEDQNNSGSPFRLKEIKSQRLAKALQEAEKSGMRVVRQSEDEIVMEIDIELDMSLMNNPDVSLHQGEPAIAHRRVVMQFSGDLSQMKTQKIYENKQLVEMISYEYVDNDPSTPRKAPGVISENIPASNIKSVDYRRLQFMEDGAPYVLVTQEKYIKNKININL